LQPETGLIVEQVARKGTALSGVTALTGCYRMHFGQTTVRKLVITLQQHVYSVTVHGVYIIYRTIILPVVLYGCETWSLTLREEHRLRVFENRVLRRI
jgi:hypothetical protein